MKNEDKLNNEGVLEDLLYSNTPYDNAFRTMEGECDNLLIPLVNFFFNEEYDETAQITRLRNEHFIEKPDGSSKKKITDSHFGISDKEKSKLYHIECESGKYDGTILVKMFEYGSQIAIDGNDGGRFRLNVSYPNAGILLLRGREIDPDEAEIAMNTPGGAVSFGIPIFKVRDFDIATIFDKKLYFLIPFLIFNFEPRFNDLDKDEKGRNKII